MRSPRRPRAQAMKSWMRAKKRVSSRTSTSMPAASCQCRMSSDSRHSPGSVTTTRVAAWRATARSISPCSDWVFSGSSSLT